MAVLITSKKVLRTDSVSIVATSDGTSFVNGKNLQISCNLSSAIEQKKGERKNALSETNL